MPFDYSFAGGVWGDIFRNIFVKGIALGSIFFMGEKCIFALLSFAEKRSF